MRTPLFGYIRARHKRLRMLVAVSALAVSGAVVASGPSAQAADGPFFVDGLVPDGPPNPGTAPTELEDPEGNVQELGPLNSNTTKIGVIHSDALPTLGTTNPNAQVDLRRAWLDSKREAGKDWLYFAWERDKNTGSGFIAYEFMQKPPPAGCAYGTATEAQLIANCNPWANRDGDTDGAGPDIGDFLILWDQQGNSTDLFLRVWTGTAPNLTLSPATQLNAAVSQAAFSADGFRGEAAVNLTDTIFGGSTACLLISNTIPSTVTGNSDTADYKDTILATTPPISNCQSTTVTTPTDDGGTAIPADGVSIGTGVVAVEDSAVVNIQGGTATPAGSVAFSLCKVDAPGLCTSGGTAVGSTNLTGTAYPVTVVSPTAYVTSAGRYCWRATFSGDSANGIPGSSDSRATECFTVNPVTPTLPTTAGSDVPLGTAVTDSAELSGTATQPADPVINLTGTGGAPAGGTIEFTLLKADCTTLATGTGTNPQSLHVSGDDTYGPVSFTPDSAGTYHWTAEYIPAVGDPNNVGSTHNADCTDADEDVVVETVASSLTTTQSWVPNDSATVSAEAGGDLDGSVSFALYRSSDCTGTAIYGPVEVDVSGASPQTVETSNTTEVTASGSFSWLVSYDSDNLAQDDIPASCHETSALTITNGGTVSSP
jgi:hypothetical protein